MKALFIHHTAAGREAGLYDKPWRLIEPDFEVNDVFITRDGQLGLSKTKNRLCPPKDFTCVITTNSKEEILAMWDKKAQRFSTTWVGGIDIKHIWNNYP